MALLEVAARGRNVDALALTIVNDAVAARADAREGVFGRRMHVAASVSGIAFLTDRTSRAYGWAEVDRIDVQHRSVVVRTSAPMPITRRFRLVVDEVEEPELSQSFAGVLEERGLRRTGLPYAASRSTRSRTCFGSGTYAISSGPACSVP